MCELRAGDGHGFGVAASFQGRLQDAAMLHLTMFDEIRLLGEGFVVVVVTLVTGEGFGRAAMVFHVTF